MLAVLLDELEKTDRLPRMILYSPDPGGNSKRAFLSCICDVLMFGY